MKEKSRLIPILVDQDVMEIELMYEVFPLNGIGPVWLGMTREESRSAMGIEPETFRKIVDSASLTDAYYDTSFQVFFNENDIVEYIELSSGGPLPVMNNGSPVFETEAESLVRIISKDAPYDENDPELGYSYIFPLLELSLWCPIVPENSNDEEGKCFLTIGVGRKGYYSEPNPSVMVSGVEP